MKKQTDDGNGVQKDGELITPHLRREAERRLLRKRPEPPPSPATPGLRRHQTSRRRRRGSVSAPFGSHKQQQTRGSGVVARLGPSRPNGSSDPVSGRLRIRSSRRLPACTGARQGKTADAQEKTRLLAADLLMSREPKRRRRGPHVSRPERDAAIQRPEARKTLAAAGRDAGWLEGRQQQTARTHPNSGIITRRGTAVGQK